MTFVLFDFYFSQEPHLMVLRNQVVWGINLGLLHAHLTISHQTQGFKAPGFLIDEDAVFFFFFLIVKLQAPISFLTLAVAPSVLGVCVQIEPKSCYTPVLKTVYIVTWRLLEILVGSRKTCWDVFISLSSLIFSLSCGLSTSRPRYMHF